MQSSYVQRQYVVGDFFTMLPESTAKATHVLTFSRFAEIIYKFDDEGNKAECLGHLL